MKKIIIVLMACLWFTNIKAQDKKTPAVQSNYCLLVKGEDQVLMRNGKEITDEVRLSNGDHLSPNGRITKMNGTEIKLKEGDCVTVDGVVIRKKAK